MVIKNKLLHEISELEENAHFKFSDEEKKMFLKDYRKFKKALAQFNKIELLEVKPADFPFEVYQSELREDVIERTNLEKEIIRDKYFLKNSQNIEGDFFVIKKNNGNV